MKIKHKTKEYPRKEIPTEEEHRVRKVKKLKLAIEDSVLDVKHVNFDEIVQPKKLRKSKRKEKTATNEDEQNINATETDSYAITKKVKKKKHEKDHRKLNKHLRLEEDTETHRDDTIKMKKLKHKPSKELSNKQDPSESEQTGKTKRRRKKKKKKKLFNKRNKYLHLILPKLSGTSTQGNYETPVNLKVPLTSDQPSGAPTPNRKRKKTGKHEDANEIVSKKVKVVDEQHQEDAQLSGSENEQLSKSQKKRKKKKLQRLSTMVENEPFVFNSLTKSKKRSHTNDTVEQEVELPIKKVKRSSPSVLSRENVFLHNGDKLVNESTEPPTLKRKKKTDKSDPSYITEKSMTLKDRMIEKLSASRFRYLNEQLYSMTGREAFELFHNDSSAYEVYHNGFKNQVAKWPIKPLDVIVKSIKSKPSSLVIADFGCGDAELATRVKNTVHSFDLVAVNDSVVACDMSKVPLKTASVDIAVFCLALMGTNIIDYIAEAHRVLKYGGTMKIAEVESRFRNVDHFIKAIQKLGFTLVSKDLDKDMFVFFDFEKSGQFHRKLVTKLKLNPCLYKKR